MASACQSVQQCIDSRCLRRYDLQLRKHRVLGGRATHHVLLQLGKIPVYIRYEETCGVPLRRENVGLVLGYPHNSTLQAAQFIPSALSAQIDTRLLHGIEVVLQGLIELR